MITTTFEAALAIRMSALMACDRAELRAVVVMVDSNTNFSMGMNTANDDVAIAMLQAAIQEIERRREAPPVTKPSIQ
jgi:hypothetical protein